MLTCACTFLSVSVSCLFLCVCPCSWKTPGGVFQAYGSYWPEGYIAHLAWAATWMCRYDASACPTAVQWFNTAMSTNNLRYGLGYDWDSTFPGVAALVISMGLQPLVDPARQYLEGYILPKWMVSRGCCSSGVFGLERRVLFARQWENGTTQACICTSTQNFSTAVILKNMCVDSITVMIPDLTNVGRHLPGCVCLFPPC